MEIDRWGVDAAYSGTQKCIGCPPGLSPLTFSEAALERVRARATRCRSWYLDLTLIGSYFGSGRVYHHTAPISAIYGLAAGLDRVLDEGLPARFARHAAAGQRLVAGLAPLGFEPLVAEDVAIALVPRMGRVVLPDTVVAVEVEDPTPERTVQLIWRRSGANSAALALVRRELESVVAERWS